MSTFNKTNISNLVAINFKSKECDTPSLGEGIKSLIKQLNYIEMNEFASAPRSLQFATAVFYGMIEVDGTRVFDSIEEVSVSLTLPQMVEVAGKIASFGSADVKSKIKK